MGNDEAFRKVRDKLAGFESDLRDDSWQLFEKHRRKKERDRKLAGAMRVGMLVLLILGILAGSWIFLESGRRAARFAKSGTNVQKRVAGAGIAKINKADSPHLQAAGRQEDLRKTANATGLSAKSEIVHGNFADAGSLISVLMHSHADSSIAASQPGQYLQIYPKILSSKPLSSYDVNLQLPPIPQSKINTAEDTGRTGRRFQLSLGPAMRANYAKPSENRLTLGPAVFGTFPVTRAFSLRGGIALMREHVYVSNTSPEFSRNAVRWLSRGDYHWWNFDIPVDIQVALHRNPRYSVSGVFGVSSSLYWGEHFKELYQKDKIVTTTLALYNGEVKEVQGLASKQEDPLTGRNSGFAFAPASYFNVSVMLERRINSRRSVIIEPQLRYPIGGVTSRHLKFTSIGVQIRILYK